MATAHKVMATLKKKNGQTHVCTFTTADTTTTALLSPSGSDQIVLSQEDCWLVDWVHSTQGTCTQVYLYFNNVRIPDIILTAASQPGVNRQIPASPIFIPGGTLFKATTIT